jgi:hypothetical protein
MDYPTSEILGPDAISEQIIELQQSGDKLHDYSHHQRSDCNRFICVIDTHMTRLLF